ncbi:MAG: branched-chain amino acid ABC transporter permease [Rhodospirillaceae bacterium]|nr:branched-chain amino acid ABC transporter permease [Rhodospirillaceae bacterium]
MDPLIVFVQAVIGGVSIGCIYALVALGFVLIYKATEVVNFAQGELMMVGAFFAYTLVDLGGVPFIPGVLLALVATGAFGMLINRLLLRPLIGSPAFTIVLATVAVSTLLRALATMVPGWGVETHRLSNPIAGKVVKIGPLVVSAEHLMVMGVTVLLVSLLWLFFSRARIGVALQATSQNQLAAGYAGINVRRMFGLIWGISAAVAALAGVLLAPSAFVHVNMGYIGLKAFPAAVLGGFGSLPGAVVGGVAIGVIEELAGLYLPEGVKNVAAYVVLLAVLMVRPQGLFGISKRVRV